MIITISTTHCPATDIGYLLHKHPESVHKENLSFGTAYVFYSEATSKKCTVNLLLDIDPLELCKWGKSSSSKDIGLDLYVNDRPYTASSFLSVAIKKVFSTAMSGVCQQRPDLVETWIPLSITIPVIAYNGEESFIKNIFNPLGYSVQVENYPLDSHFPEWGNSRYCKICLEATVSIFDLLHHLYILIPILDNSKHYWVDDKEVEKLLEKGGTWLATHPYKKLIISRALKYRQPLIKQAMSHLTEELSEEKQEEEQLEEAIEKKLSLHDFRLDFVKDIVLKSEAKTVLDLGCGEGKLIKRLLPVQQVEKIIGVDVSYRTLETAHDRLKVEFLPERQRNKLKLLHGSLIYQDSRLKNFDIATVVEVIEHLELAQLEMFEKNLFFHMRPKAVILTTPNKDYNVLFETLPAGKFRHPDHRFEWTRAEFSTWATQICSMYNYEVQLLPVGEEHSIYGAPSQMALFTIKNTNIL